MEHPGLSFLMNLNGNNVASIHGEAPELLKEPSDSGAFNAFFTNQAGLSTNDGFGAEGDIQALMNSASSGFLRHIDLAGTGFGVDAPEDFTIKPDIDRAIDAPNTETLLVHHGFDRRIRGGVSDRGNEQIERLDTPNRLEQVRGRTRPDFSIGLRAVKNDAPAIAKHAETMPVDGDNPEFPAITEEQYDIGAIKNRAYADIFTIGQQRFAPVPAAPKDELSFGKAANGLALQVEQPPARNIEPKPELGIGAKPAHNQNSPLNNAHYFDNAAITTHPNEAKRQITPANNEVLLDVESADPGSDEARFFESRFASRSETGGMTPAVSTATPVMMTAFAAAPAVVERLAGDDRHSTPAIEAAGFMQPHLSGERAPVQFAPPTTLPPAGAAWAQVISAISERNGETKLELRLNPPELGRVTIAFEGDGADIVRAVVSADSQQTLDLMRRNIDILQRELARAGLDNVNVELADRDARSQSRDDANEQTVAYAAIDDTSAQLNNNIPLAPLVADGRLDLRV